MSFTDRLKQLRKDSKKTQLEVAELLGIERTAYTHYETGKRSPSLDTLSKIATVYNCSVDYLLGKTELKKPLEIIIRDAGEEYDPEHGIAKDKMPTELKELGLEYIQLAEDIKAEDLTPDDIRELIALIKKLKKSSDN